MVMIISLSVPLMDIDNIEKKLQSINELHDEDIFNKYTDLFYNNFKMQKNRGKKKKRTIQRKNLNNMRRYFFWRDISFRRVGEI